MKITIEPTVPLTPVQKADTVSSKVSVEHPYDDLNIDEAGRLVRQALVAWGFAEETVNEYFGGEE